MKKSLLLLTSLLMSVASFAQWVKPVPAVESSYQYSTLAAEGAGDTIAYYIYNKKAKAFLTQGNAWGTQASIANTGLKFLVSKYVPEGGEWDGKTVLLTDYCATKTAWYLIFIDSETGSFVDKGNQANYFWEIESMGNSTFRIYGADINPEYNSKTYGNGAKAYFGMSYSVDANTTAVTPLIDLAEDPTAQVDWQFVSEASYAAYLEKLAPYEAAEALLKRIEQVKSNPDYASISTADAEAVYNNTNSSLEALQTAERKLGAAIKNIEFGAATEENPMDATKFLANANFDSGVDGWTNTFVAGKTGTNIGAQGASYDNGDIHIKAFIEAWANSAFSTAIQTRALGVGEISQTILDMPQGKYKFTVDAISNNQDGKEVHGVELFATGGDLNIFKKVATGNGLPEHFEITFVNDGDEITMGVRTTEECTANWIALDNFTLTYYGPTTKTPEELSLEATIAAALEAYPAEEMDDLVANKAVKDALTAAIEAGQSATEDFASLEEAVDAAKKALDASVAVYKAFSNKVNEISDYLAKDDLEGENADYIVDYVMDDEMAADETYPYGNALVILTELTATDEQIVAETARIDSIYHQAMLDNMYEGKDFTNFLVNPDFSAGNSTGWTVNINPTNFAWTGGLLNVPVCESWHSYFDISQEVTAPDGIYSISLNGFCRLDDGVDTEVPAEVYINNFSSKLMNINADPVSEDDAVDGFNAYLSNGTGGAWTTNPIFQDKDGNPCKRQSPADNTDSLIDGGYVPNGMEGASVAFSAGRYKAVAYGLCEGGKLIVGVRNRVSTHVWALWGNFKLTYMGKNVEALQSILPSYVEQLENYAEENEDNITAPVAKDINAALSQAVDAGTDADDLYDALVAVNGALVSAKENVAAIEALRNKIDELADALEGETPNPQGVALYEANSDALDEGNFMALTTKGVTELQAKVEEILAAVLEPMWENATDATPVDATAKIKNPSFETGTTDGWANASGTGDTGAKENSNATYTISNADGNYVFNTWSGSAVDGGFFVSQTVTGLAAGTYELTALVASDAGNTITLAGNSATNDVTLTTPKEEGVDLSVYVTIGEEGTIEIKASSETWFKADNFRLTYFGKDSEHKDETAISSVSSTVAPVAIYTISGTRVDSLQKGVNIVKMANGSVKKVLVK